MRTIVGARRVFLFVVLLALAAMVGVAPVREAALRAAGGALVAEDPLGPADIIVIPEWAGGAGALGAADLFHSGMAKRVAVLAGSLLPEEREFTRRGVGYEDEVTRMAQRIVSLGVPAPERISGRASGTEAEGEVLADWCDRNQFTSVVVVSSPDHSRRLQRVLRRSMQGRRTRVSVRSTPYSAFDPNDWWTNRNGLRIGLIELEKLMLDVARYPLS